MTSLRQRQVLLSIVSLVTIGSTVLVAAASARTQGQAPEAWVGSWAAAPAEAPLAGPGVEDLSVKGFEDQTIRMVLRTSIGGSKGRIRLTNRFGDKPLVIGHTTIGRPLPSAGPGDLVADSVQDVTFNGQKSVTIPKGGTVISDAVSTEIPWAQEVSVSIFLPEETGPPTVHYFAKTTSYIGPGDNTADPSGAKLSKHIRTWYFLSGLEVLNRTGQGTIAVLSDSIGDGYATTSNAHRRWTDYLATRLNSEAPNRAPGIVNVSMSGNRLGRDGDEIKLPMIGINASARFYSDVVGQTGVRAVILALGINDVWISQEDPDVIINHLRQLAVLARQAGLKIYACTLMPWEAYESAPGVVAYTPALDSIRLTVNSYLRTTSDFDGVIDFDLVMRDPTTPSRLRTDFDSGDHIHPNDAGNEAMAAAVPIDMLLED
jgi:lysophospholipase L1-like esterase